MKLDANIKGGTWDPVYTCFRKVYVTLCHHQTFNQECLNNGIFPVEVRAFATCATVAADDKLREEYVRLLTKASMEITAANMYHLQKKENEIEGRIMKILAAQKDKNTKNKTISTCWKTRREAEELHDELKEKRKKKLVVTIHKHRNGEVYLEACLRPEAMRVQVPRRLSHATPKPNNQSPKPRHHPNCPAPHTGAKTKLKTPNHHPDYPVTVNKPPPSSPTRPLCRTCSST